MTLPRPQRILPVSRPGALLKHAMVRQPRPRRFEQGEGRKPCNPSYRPETIEMVARVLTPAIWLTASEVRLCLPQTLALGTVRNVLDILLSENRALAEAGRPAHGGRANKWYRGPGRSR